MNYRFDSVDESQTTYYHLMISRELVAVVVIYDAVLKLNERNKHTQKLTPTEQMAALSLRCKNSSLNLNFGTK